MKIRGLYGLGLAFGLACLWSVASFVIAAYTMFRYTGLDVQLARLFFILPDAFANVFANFTSPTWNIFYNSAWILYMLDYILTSITVSFILVYSVILLLQGTLKGFAKVLPFALYLLVVVATLLLRMFVFGFII
jgi:hypothetical protein